MSQERSHSGCPRILFSIANFNRPGIVIWAVCKHAKPISFVRVAKPTHIVCRLVYLSHLLNLQTALLEIIYADADGVGLKYADFRVEPEVA